MKLKCLLAMLLLTFLSCSNTPAVEDKIDSLPHSEPGKTLIVYFSWSGHTQTVANIIHELIGCDMVEIEPEEPYSDEYNEVVDRFKNERDNHILPALRTKVENMDDYDIVFVGCPVWWHTAPMAIWSFLESKEYNLKGKIIVPFCTYAATYRDETLAKIVELTPDSEHLKGFGSTGSTSGAKGWLKEIGIIK